MLSNMETNIRHIHKLSIGIRKLLPQDNTVTIQDTRSHKFWLINSTSTRLSKWWRRKAKKRDFELALNVYQQIFKPILTRTIQITPEEGLTFMSGSIKSAPVSNQHVRKSNTPIDTLNPKTAEKISTWESSFPVHDMDLSFVCFYLPVCFYLY